MRIRTVALVTHRRHEELRDALAALLERVQAAGMQLRVPAAEADRHELRGIEGVTVCADDSGLRGADLAVALGGDGTILRVLRAFAGTGVPTFGVNFGQIGFLATVEAQGCAVGLQRALAGDFELLRLPAIGLTGPVGMGAAVNDVSLHRRPGERVAVLSYSLEGEELGSVRSDGIVVATPAGSTGYNLANGGPVLAWGVEGYVVSFIAPHSLTARALVVAPGDRLTISNRSADDGVDISVDGRPAGALEPGQAVECRFVIGAALLAQLPGTTFYRRMRDKFGALAT